MNHLYTIIALDIARERSLEAAMSRRAALAQLGPGRPGLVRRGLAHGLALVSRGSADAARRLDGYTVDDRSQALAAGK